MRGTAYWDRLGGEQFVASKIVTERYLGIGWLKTGIIKDEL